MAAVAARLRRSPALLLPLFATIGFVLGATGPSRDLIVRNATPQGASGRVYGFVYSGLDLGATIGADLVRRRCSTTGWAARCSSSSRWSS